MRCTTPTNCAGRRPATPGWTSPSSTPGWRPTVGRDHPAGSTSPTSTPAAGLPSQTRAVSCVARPGSSRRPRTSSSPSVTIRTGSGPSGSVRAEADMSVPDTPRYEDGNALAGPLREIFAVDVTAAVSQCATCRLAGMVARCPGCDEVVLRLVRTPDAAWLDLRGAINLRIPLPEG